MSLGDTALIALISAMSCLLVGRPAIRLLARAQCLAPVRYEDCPPLQAYQQTKSATPTMGGLFVLSIGVVAAVVSGGLSHRNGWFVLGAILGLGAIGWWDDCLKFRGQNARGLRSLPKLLIALAIGAAIGWCMLAATPVPSLNIPWMQRSIELGWVWVPLSAVVVAGCAHAVNLTDGMDGLAAGCVAIALLAVGLLANPLEPTTPAIMPWCASLAGACLGFLWFNSFPASVYLGDIGALGLGAALGTIGLLTHGALWLMIVGGVFVIEAVSVMLQVASYKWRNQRRIFRVAPIHHHFHLGGLAEPKVIVRFWIVGALLAMAGLTQVRW